MRAPDDGAPRAIAGRIPVERQLDLDQHRVDVVDRRVVGSSPAAASAAGRAPVQIGEQRGRRGVARGVGAAGFDDGLEPKSSISARPSATLWAIDARRRVAERAQALAHGDERRGCRCDEPGDRGVGLAEAQRRPVRPRRRDHQDRRRAVGLGQPLVGAARGVAVHCTRLASLQPALSSSASTARARRSARSIAPVRADGSRRDARRDRARRRIRSAIVEPLGGQARGGASRPIRPSRPRPAIASSQPIWQAPPALAGGRNRRGPPASAALVDLHRG